MFRSLFVKSQARKFTYRPYYYKPSAETEDGDKPRIQFRRLRRRPQITSRSLRLKILLLVILLFVLYYFQGLVNEESTDFKVESIRIE